MALASVLRVLGCLPCMFRIFIIYLARVPPLPLREPPDAARRECAADLPLGMEAMSLAMTLCAFSSSGVSS